MLSLKAHINDTNQLALFKLSNQNNIPRHIAIIMDGNGRWAKQHQQERIYGHNHGVDSVRAAIKTASNLGVEFLTLFTFSTENWARPEDEVTGLMALLSTTILDELEEMQKQGIKLDFIGNIDQMPENVQYSIKKARELNPPVLKTTVIIAVNYGAREEIINATKLIARDVKQNNLDIKDIDNNLFAQKLYSAKYPDPDLLIRTSGEIRLSNFLLWQLSYTEMYFTEVLWPDFDENQLIIAVQEFQRRQRRYGKI